MQTKGSLLGCLKLMVVNIKTGEHISRMVRSGLSIQKRSKNTPILEQSLFKVLVCQSPAALLMVNSQNTISFASPAAESLLHCLPGGLSGKAFGFTPHVGSISEQPFTTPDNQKNLILEVQAEGIEWEGVPYYLVTLHDVTLHKQIQQVLQVSEERFRTIADFTYDWEIWLAPDGSLLYVSPACKRITGYSAEEFLSTPGLFENCVHAEDRQRVMAHVAEELEYFNLSSITFRVISRRGKLRWINSRSQPVFDSSSNYLGRRFSNSDITAGKRAEENLLESEERFRSFIAQSQDGMFLIDTTGRVISWNQSEEKITSLKRNQVIERPFWDIWMEYAHPGQPKEENLEEVKAAVLEALKNGKSTWLNHLHEVEMTQVDGSQTIIQERYFPVKTRRGYQIGCIARDITEAKTAETLLHQLNQQLEERVQLRTRQLTEEIAGRKQAERELEVRLEIERMLADIAARFIRSDFEHAMPGVLQLIGRVSAASMVRLYNINETGRVYQCVYEWRQDFPFSEKGRSSIPVDALSPWVSALALSKIIYIEDPRQISSDLIGDSFESGKQNSPLILLPIVTSIESYGFISLVNASATTAWRGEGLRLLEVLSQVISSALERSRFMHTLEQQVRDRTGELETLYKIATLASKPVEIGDFLAQALQETMRVIDGEAGFIHLLEEEGGNFKLAQQINLAPDFVNGVETLTWDGGMLDWVFARRDPLIITDIRQQPGWPENLFEPYTAYIGVPMRLTTSLVGVLGLLGKNFNHLTLEQLTLLSAIADQISVAVESARLRDQAKEAAIIEERQRLARELHDSVTQYLYSLVLLTKGWQRGLHKASPEEIKHWLERSENVSNQALKEMRLLLYNLRPAILEQDGLAGALKRRLEAVEGRVEIKTELEVDEDLKLPPHIEQELYGIAQEALNNVLKYAEATKVVVRLCRKPGGVELEIMDNGNGFNLQAMAENGGQGIVNMQERARNLGSSLGLQSNPGQGTSIKVYVKIPQGFIRDSLLITDDKNNV
jgi:PAS domain S-box-containing protein